MYAKIIEGKLYMSQDKKEGYKIYKIDIPQCPEGYENVFEGFEEDDQYITAKYKVIKHVEEPTIEERLTLTETALNDLLLKGVNENE